MKNISLVLVVIVSLALAFQSNAQSNSEKKKMEKAARKAAKMEKDSIDNANLRALVETRAFVLEANTLYSRVGDSFVINPVTNFVGFDGKYSTIQLAFDQVVGWNGVGGVTLDGTITKMEIVDNKSGFGFTITANVRQNVGSTVTMLFRVSIDGSARVDISGSFSDRLIFQGRIVSLAETRVYKGTTTY